MATVPTPPNPPDDPSQGGWSDPGEPVPAAVVPRPAPGTRYTIGPLIGRGGMGAVYVARDALLGRDVALKELKPELARNPTAMARLEREAAITSRLDHPGIIAVHDVGTLPDGRPFYTMRLVRGETLSHAAGQATSPGARRQLVRYVLAAADAVAAAHDAGIVHRDLKPSNILIGPHGETQVADWGLATPAASAAARWTDLPAGESRGAVGTAPYMAPEQARGEPPDPRHDVWSLGITLAEIMGARSESLSTGAPPALDLPPEIAAIVARATTPVLTERYPDAAAFADDLLRWFEGRRVYAHAYTPGELLRRTLRTYRLPLVVAGLGLTSVFTTVALGWWQTTLSLDRALAAESEAADALADVQLAQAVRATRAGARAEAEQLAIAVLRHRDDPLARGVLAAFGRAERPTVSEDDPGPECSWSAVSPTAAFVICGHDGLVERWERGAVVWSVAMPSDGGSIRGADVLVSEPAGTTVLDAGRGGVRSRTGIHGRDWLPEAFPRAIWTGEAVFPFAATPASGCLGRLKIAATSPDGRIAAVCTDGTMLVGTLDDPLRLRIPTDLHGDHDATALAWTPDGRIAAGTLRGRVYVYDGDSGALVAAGETSLGAIHALDVRPDGELLALGGTRGGVGVWRVSTATLIAEVPAGPRRSFAFVGAGLRVHDGRIRVWRIPSGTPSVVRGPSGIADISASSDGRVFATAAGDGGIVRVSLQDGVARRVMLGDRVAKAVAFDPAGTALVATGMGEPRLAIADGETWVPLAHARPLRRVAWLPDGSIVGVDLDAGLYRWADSTALPTILEPERVFQDLEREGQTLVVLDALGRVDRLVGTTLTEVAREPGARAVAIRGSRLAIIRVDEVRIHDAAGARSIPAPGASLLDVALSADGSRVAASDLDGLVHVWDAATGTLLGQLPGHTERVVALEFLPDGDLLSASWDKSARIGALGALTRPVEALAAEVDAAWGAGEWSPARTAH